MSDMDDRIPIRGITRWVTDKWQRMKYRPWLAFDGNVTVIDDPTYVDPISGKVVGKTTVTVGDGEGGGGAPLSDVAPPALGTAAAGNATTAARGNHVHAHGDLAGGSLHAAAIASGAAGFMTGADKAKLDGVAAGATANVGTVTSVSGSDGISVATGTSTPALSLSNAGIALAKLANIATARFLGRTTAGSGAVEELTATQATAMLNEATTSLKGLLSSAFWQLLDGATDAATASALMRRDANADVAARRVEAEQIQRTSGAFAVAAINGAMTITETAGHGLTMSTPGALNIGGGAATRFGGAGQTTLILGVTRSINRYYYADGVDRGRELYAADQAQTTTAETTPTGFTLTPSATRPTHYVVRIAQRIGDDEAVHVFDFWARAIGGVARFTGGAPPVGVTATTPAVAAFQAAMEESGGTIRARTQRDTASSVTETFEVFEVC